MGDLRRPRRAASIPIVPTWSISSRGQAIRDEIARVVPIYAGIETLRRTGDSVQWGGARLCEGGVFPTPDGKGPVHRRSLLPTRDVPKAGSVLSTRRGQAVQHDGVPRRRPVDRRVTRRRASSPRPTPRRLGLSDGAAVLVRSEHGHIRGHLKVGGVRPGNVQVFWPEGNPLLPPRIRDGASGVPDYNAVVEITARSEIAGANCSLTRLPRAVPRRLRRAAARPGAAAGGAAPRAHRAPRAVRARRRRRRRGPRRARPRAGVAIVSEESGRSGPRGRRDHRRRRPRRRLDELRARDPVLGDLAVRGRRRGSACARSSPTARPGSGHRDARCRCLV